MYKELEIYIYYVECRSQNIRGYESTNIMVFLFK